MCGQFQRLEEGRSGRAINTVDSAAPTFIGDGKMGRARSQSRGIYAMGSPRTNTSRFFSTKDDTEETETESVRMDNTAAVSC